MIQLQQVSLSRGAKPLFENASLSIFPGQKAGVTGANGSGKSSLFALLRGLLLPERGQIDFPASWQIAHVAQETPALPEPALEFVMDGDEPMRTLERSIALAEQQDSLHLGELHAQFASIGGYSARAKAGSLLNGLGFSSQAQTMPVASFSGGWRMRLNLARALMCRSDLLLLDEPTNHLDLEAILWLEEWLIHYPGTLLLVSHDRDFLDSVTTHTLHIEHQALRLYSGNYSAFEIIRAEQLAHQQSLRERQERQRAHLESFIERFRAKATKARQAQSRIKALAKMGSVAAAYADSPFEFSFLAATHAPDPLLTLSNIQCGYSADQPILHNVTLSLRSGDRLGILGSNGSGKSTLVKLLAGVLPPMTGERVAGQGLRIGYFAQHQLEQLDPDGSPLQHVLRLSPDTPEHALRDYLGGFNFRGDMALQACAHFSGGEKTRLALALLIWQRPNLILMDEPTNHLDMDMRQALEQALQGYAGAMVLISHDRALLESTCDQFILVNSGSVTPFDGDLDDYRRFIRQETAPAVITAKPSVGKEEHSRRRQQEAEQRKLSKMVAKLENDINQYNTELMALDHQLANPDLYVNPTQNPELQALLTKQTRLKAALEQAETDWLSAHDTLSATTDG